MNSPCLAHVPPLGNGSPQHRVSPCRSGAGLHRRPPPGARAGRRRRLADQARFKALDLHVMSKPDLTPVTDADEAVEESIRRTLSRVRSRDAVTGEEQGSTGHSQRRWIVDPIDGTKNFVRGVPVWATLIALAVDDEVVLGVVSAPLLQRRWWASAGAGAWTGRSLLKATQCHVSDVRRLEDASLSYSSLRGWDDRGQGDDFVVADATGLAVPRVRRLLVLHAARRGRRRHRHRARAGRARHGGAGRDRARGRRHVHLAGRRGRTVGRQRAGHQRPPARRGAVVPGRGGRGRRTTPTGSPSGPGSVSELRPRGPRPVDDADPSEDSDPGENPES